mmetsp:Transcript_31983/g.37288  ORF Transcript_31983/g.37288 Transcript_31983/m.37288 type:complete len:483 (-) Transcript_31983:44-1492(-)
MGGTKPTFVPFPTFKSTSPATGGGNLAATGRCRINPKTCTESRDEFDSILSKNIEQSQVDDTVEDEELKSNNKKLKKKYMKQGVAMAQSYLSKSLKVDASIIDVEILLDASMIIQSGGCIVACFLDAGCDKIAVSDENIDMIVQAMNFARVPSDRIAAHFDVESLNDMLLNSSNVIQKILDLGNTISIESSNNITKEECISLITKIGDLTGSDIEVANVTVVIQILPNDNCEDIVSSVSKFCSEGNNPRGTVSLIDPSAQLLGLSYAACIRTDRVDGLYTTVVCTRSNEALGLVYSSKESIVAALECGRGVYYSRSRNGLWRKGDTSGHYQTLHRIDVDCDGDALRFTVTQRGDDCAAFCHLNTLTCWGEPKGVRHLESTLKERLGDAPVGSYTKRLFDDEKLLRDKLVEEAQELSEAKSKQHVAEELADVLYFAMVKAAKAGVSIDDAAAELDKRARKVTRRKGDSKAFRIEAGNTILHKK